MEENCESDSSKLLIDFNSPISKRPLTSPLIPIPRVENLITVSPTNSNPFDVVARQTIPPDPFESVLKTASQNVDEKKSGNQKQNVNIEPDDLGSDGNQKIVKSGIFNDEKLDIESSPPIYKVASPAENIEKTNGKGLSGTGANVGAAVKTSIKTSNLTPVKTPSKSLDLLDSESKLQVSNDFSTEEGLKAVIAKRVNKCIQSVLNNSLRRKCSNPSDNLKNVADKTPNKQTKNRKSLSFMAVSPSVTKSDKLNKSFSDFSKIDVTFNVENQEFPTPDSSNGSCDIRRLSSLSGEISTNEESGSLNFDKEEIFKEANKLARTFSRIAESFCNTRDSDNEDDLLSCKPRWFYADSSEDEEEKLRNDPSLNVRVSLANSLVLAPSGKTIESPALSAFKKNRRSLDLSPNFVQEDSLSTKKDLSIGAKPPVKQAPLLPIIVTTAPPIVLPNREENPIRLKKSARDSKRGPIKAVMPLQSMTKDMQRHEDKRTRKDISPVRKPNSIHTMETPNKFQDNSQLGIQPVASSTPNKIATTLPTNLLTPIFDKSHKRHSLGSTNESRKSRTPLVDGSVRQRSNSASSHIPAPVASVKPFKGGPDVKSPIKTKSSSCLPRVSASNAQAKVQCGKNPNKNSTKPARSSFNPRALNEVKPKTGRVKSAVNSISNFVTGKSKKAVTRDKENRNPV